MSRNHFALDLLRPALANEAETIFQYQRLTPEDYELIIANAERIKKAAKKKLASHPDR